MAPFYRGFQLVAWICDESPFRGVSIRDDLIGVFHHGDDCPTEADARAWIDAQYEAAEDLLNRSLGEPK